jgi:hypothetical protein
LCSVHRNVLHVLKCKFIYVLLCPVLLSTEHINTVTLCQKTQEIEILSFQHNVSLIHDTFYTSIICKASYLRLCFYEKELSSLLAKCVNVCTTLCAENKQMVKQEKCFLMIQYRHWKKSNNCKM